MKILYTTDLHGNREKYRGIEELALREKVAAVLNGGDLLPAGPDLHEVQAEFIQGFLASHMAALCGAGIRFLGILGNDDLGALDELFRNVCRRTPGAHDLSEGKVELGGHEFLGFQLVQDYPFRLKDRCRRDGEDDQFPPQRGSGILSTPGGFRELPDWFLHARSLPTLEEELARLPAPRDPARAVYLIHQPPAGLGLDCAGDGRQVGSRAVHAFIRKVQPLLTLHGHIHESPDVSQLWSNRVGRTICIQPGARGALLGVLIDLEIPSAALRHLPSISLKGNPS